MNARQIEYLRYRMERAENTLQEAKVLLMNDHLHGTVNRLYYSCFHAVTALLFLEGLSANKHSGVRSLFDLHWVKPGRLPTHMGRFYHLLFRYRQQSDYGDGINFEANDVESWFHEAETFVPEIVKQIEKQLLEQQDEEQGHRHD